MFFADAQEFGDGSAIDIDIVLSKLNPCSNDPNFNVSTFFAAHSVNLMTAIDLCA